VCVLEREQCGSVRSLSAYQRLWKRSAQPTRTVNTHAHTGLTQPEVCTLHKHTHTLKPMPGNITTQHTQFESTFLKKLKRK